MTNKWTGRERKLSVRAKHRRQSGRFKDKENRNKNTGKQRKIYNQIRRLREDDESTYNDEEVNHNNE